MTVSPQGGALRGKRTIRMATRQIFIIKSSNQVRNGSGQHSAARFSGNSRSEQRRAAKLVSRGGVG
jgi:hypothetical protein